VNRFQRAGRELGIPQIRLTKQALSVPVAVLVALSSLMFNAGLANANTVSNASVALSDPQPGATSSYSFTGGGGGASTQFQSAVVRCIRVTFSTSSSSVSTPSGFTAASATVTAGSSTLINSSSSGWSPTASANTFSYTHSTGVTPSTTSGATFVLAGITNSNTANTGYFYRLSTYGNTDCSTTPLDTASTMFINTAGSQLSLTVDSSLTFTVNAVASSQSCNGTTTTAASTSTTIPFGTVTTASNGVVCQDLTASTNASNGYTISTRYTAAPTNGLGQTIDAWTGTNGSPTTFPSAGVDEAYGYTTDDASLSVTGDGADRFTNPRGWAGMTTSNAELAYEAAGVTSTTYRVGHQVAIDSLTETGTYSTTVIYTCTPVF
jgi:hypothetical protein